MGRIRPKNLPRVFERVSTRPPFFRRLHFLILCCTVSLLFSPTMSQANDNEAVRHFDAGNSFYNEGKYGLAISEYTEAIRLMPDYASAYNNRGNAYVKLGRYERAIADCNRALEINPELAEAYFNRGFTYNNLGQHKRAIADLDRALEINPDYAAAYINRGFAYNNLGQHKRATADHERARELNPELVDAYDNEIKALKKLAGETKPKEVEAQGAATMDADTWFQRGTKLGESGNYEEAIECFDKALEIDPNGPIRWLCWVAKSAALTNLGRPLEGLHFADKSAKDLPILHVSFVVKGWALTELGRHQEALEYYNKSLEIEPTAVAWSGKGLLLDRMGATPMEVLFSYEKALEMSPRHPPIWSKKQEPLVETPEYKKVKAAVDGG
ncbi:MAG: tetratricopeptide repeat protein [Candidatus Brocadiales bacterium]|nr:tetratricopeptide repeat protein [Candidatus Bathyanammoxibius amoris]